MIRMYSRRVVAVALVTALFASAYLLAFEDDLVRAKELYLTAEYDEALAMLNRLGQSSPRTSARRWRRTGSSACSPSTSATRPAAPSRKW
jgi:hypothetical protein